MREWDEGMSGGTRGGVEWRKAYSVYREYNVLKGTELNSPETSCKERKKCKKIRWQEWEVTYGSN